MSSWRIAPKTPEQERLAQLGYIVWYHANCMYEALNPQGEMIEYSRYAEDCWVKCYQNEYPTPAKTRTEESIIPLLRVAWAELKRGDAPNIATREIMDLMAYAQANPEEAIFDMLKWFIAIHQNYEMMGGG